MFGKCVGFLLFVPLRFVGPVRALETSAPPMSFPDLLPLPMTDLKRCRLLQTPDARTPKVRTVWIVEPGSRGPRLITAHPK